jgi:hypothetical protein
MGVNQGNFSLPQLSDLIGQTFEIEGVEFGVGGFGEYAVVSVKEKGKYRTSSKVLIQQLGDLNNANAFADDTVIVTLKKVKNYYTF